MKNNLLQILADSNKDIDNQMLMDYISGKLSNADQHSVEEWLEQNQFAADAMEGLAEFGNKEQLQDLVAQLNRDLKLFLDQKRKRREERRWKDKPWIYLAAILILSLIIIAYIIINLLSKSNH
jgi:anti-sigma factor RsiW